MGRTLRFFVTLLDLLCSALPWRAVEGMALERGTAITDPLSLRELDHGRFGLGHILPPTTSTDAPITNSQLLALAARVPVCKSLHDEFDRYIVRHKADLPDETIGVGNSFAFQLVDRAVLYSEGSRFVLAGIINR